MKIFKFISTSKKYVLHTSIFLLLAMLNTRVASAYDNSVFPPFEASKVGREINWISIHPDGERWLISECMDPDDSKGFRCDLFLYNFKTKEYQKYDLPPGYLYLYAKFSPRGSLIVAVRRPLHGDYGYDAEIKSFKNSEIFTMKLDGTAIKVMPNLSGHMKLPSMSEDETKIVYWQSATVRPPGNRTIFGHFDVHEYDIATAKEKMFAGPYRFFEARGLEYISKDQVVATAYGPSQYAPDIGKYSDQFNSSEIYIFERGEIDLPAPLYVDVEHAVDITMDKTGRVFVLATDKNDGISIFRMSNEPRHWRIPKLVPGGITRLIVSPTGQYIAFIYPLRTSRSQPPSNNVGIFDLNEARWLPVSLPPTTSAVSISHQ